MRNTLTKHQQILIIAAAIAIITIVAFEQVRVCGFVDLDDYRYVTQNPHIENGLTVNSVRWSLTSFYAANWHPLTWISHMVDIELFGLNPAGHHIVNLILHIAASVLLFVVLYQMTGQLWPGAAAALLFAVHPLHVESVAWIAERKDVLSTVLALLTILLYLAYTHSRKRSRYIAVIVVFALALAAKPMVVTLPFILLLLDYWPLQRLQLKRESSLMSIKPLVIEKLPLFVLSAGSCVLTMLAQKSHGAVASVPLVYRIANAINSYAAYLGKTFWPVNLAVFYAPDRGGIDPTALIISLIVLAAITAAVVYLRRSKYLVVGWLWFLGTLIPVIGFVKVGDQVMADRYMYLPSIGIFVMLCGGVADLSRKLNISKKALATVCVIIITTLVIQTRKQVLTWQNDYTLFQHCLAVTGDNPIAYNRLGVAYSRDRKYEQALMCFRNALKIHPDFRRARQHEALTLLLMSDFDAAQKSLEKALELDDTWVKGHRNLATIHSLNSRYLAAIDHYQKAIELDKTHARTWANLAMTHLMIGDTVNAQSCAEQAAALDPDDPQCRKVLDKCRSQQ